MTTDKMRAEFEVLCDSKNYSTEKDAFGNYWLPDIDDFWVMFQLGYAAGQKAAEAVGCVDGCIIERAVKEFTEGMSNDY